MRILFPRALTACIAAASLIACGSSKNDAPVAVVDNTPASVTAAGTLNASATAGTTISTPPAVRVLNKSGGGAAGASVLFRVLTGGGTIAPASATTDAQGNASATWTLGPAAGAQSASASVGDLAPVVFTTTAVGGPPATIVKTAGDAQSSVAGSAVAVVPEVRVVDAVGNVSADVLVTFTVTAGGGTVNGGAARTNAQGIARPTSWIVGTKAGPNTLQASAGSSVVASFSATGVAGPAASITIASGLPAELRIGETVYLMPKVFDQFGNENTAIRPTYSVQPATAAAVDANGAVVVRAAGTFSVRATSGTANASYSASVIGHPVGDSIAVSFATGAQPNGVAVTDDAIWAMNVAVYPRQLVRRNYDGLATGTSVTIAHVAYDYHVLVPMSGGTTGLIVSGGTNSSTYWFFDLATGAKSDSLYTTRYAQYAGISSDGARAYVLLEAGELKVIDMATRSFVTGIPLGAGITSFRMLHGDSLALATTLVGTTMEIDLKRSVLKRQYVARQWAEYDFTRDVSLMYVLDNPTLSMRVLRTTDQAQVGTFIIVGTKIGVAPDGRASFVAQQSNLYNGPPSLATILGDPATGFTRGPVYTPSGLPQRFLFNSTGSVLVSIAANGQIDVVR